MTQQILTDTEGKKVTAVLATMLEWKDDFPTQCLKLGFLLYLRIWNMEWSSSMITVLIKPTFRKEQW